MVNLEPLSGGFWSSAYSYRVGADDYVLRLSHMREGFTIDQAAMRFNGPQLPVPEIVEIGDALGLDFAISRRHYGRFLEEIPAAEATVLGGTLANLLQALRSTQLQPLKNVVWYDSKPSAELTWHGWLRSGLNDKSDGLVSGWRAKLAADVRLDSLFKRCEARIEQLLPVCPERRDLIHGDLLHQNVLISDDAKDVTAVFSWKCSALGDFMYDVAWCTIWSDWHPVIARSNIWQRTLEASDLSTLDLQAAEQRHHCYELQIAALHLGWCTWIDNQQDLRDVANVTERILERGPLAKVSH